MQSSKVDHEQVVALQAELQQYQTPCVLAEQPRSAEA